jgi:hypothetical protein
MIDKYKKLPRLKILRQKNAQTKKVPKQKKCHDKKPSLQIHDL